MSDDFALKIAEGRLGLLVSPDGELDLNSAEDLVGACERAMGVDTTSDQPIVLDLRRVSFMDSTGLQAVLSIGERAVGMGRSFALVRGNRQVQRLLELTRVSERLTVLEDLPAE